LPFRLVSISIYATKKVGPRHPDTPLFLVEVASLDDYVTLFLSFYDCI